MCKMYIDCRATKSHGSTSRTSQAAGSYQTTRLLYPPFNRNVKYRNYYQMLNIQFIQAQEEAEARDLGIGLLRSPDELSDGEKGNVESPTKFWRLDGFFLLVVLF